MLTKQCIEFVLLQSKVTVQIRGLSQWQQSQARPTASAGTPIYRAVSGFLSSRAMLVASHLLEKCNFWSKWCVKQNMQCTLSFAFKFMSLYMHKK